MTICTNCVHCDRSHANARCLTPLVRTVQRVNVVTGRTYWDTAFCGDVNTDGNCPHYQAKEGSNAYHGSDRLQGVSADERQGNEAAK